MFGVHDVLLRLRRIVLRPGGDPLSDNLDIGGGQRILALGHRRLLAFIRQDLLDDHALFGVSGHNAGPFVIALFEQIGIAGHHIAALRLGWLMATLAMLLEDTANVLVVTDFARFFLVGRFGTDAERRGQRQQSTGEEERSTHIHESVPRQAKVLWRDPRGREDSLAGGW